MKLPKLPKTKIVCTVGPASRSEGKLVELMKAGMNLARLNFAHGSLAQHAADIANIRSASAKAGVPCSIFIDLPGPKIRVGKLKHEPLYLKKGHVVWLNGRKLMRVFHDSIPVDYPQLSQSVQQGAMIYLNDGFEGGSTEFHLSRMDGFSKDDPAQAFGTIGPLARDHAGDPSPRFHLGLMLLWIGQPDQARAQFQQVEKEAPGTRLARLAAFFAPK